MFNKLTKLFVILGLFYQTPVYSKSASFNEFNSRDLSNYFSGIVASENKNNSDALKFFNNTKVLLKKHNAYLKRYTYSLVLEIIVVEDKKELIKKMGHKKLNIELQEKITEIPKDLAKYNLEIDDEHMSLININPGLKKVINEI